MMHHVLGNLHDTELWASYLPRVPKPMIRLAIAGVALAGGAGLGLASLPVLRAVGITLGALLILPALAAGIFAVFKWRYALSRRQQILDKVAWRGDESVLDVGCGAGILLNGAAKRIKRGKAIGIDIWATGGGGGNYRLLMDSARAEGVADRIEFKQADARQMPFDDQAFDVVMSSGALHHISHNREDHARAVSEMARVLKPGGRIVLWDIAHMIDATAGKLRETGIEAETQAAGSYLGFEMRLLAGIKTGQAQAPLAHSDDAHEHSHPHSHADHAFISYH